MVKTGSKPISELVRLAMIGDGAAFTELWDTHIDSLRIYIRSIVKTLDAFYVDDICSKSFEKAFRQISTYNPARSQFSTWLKTIAHNTALDILEQESRKRRTYVPLDDDSRQMPLLDERSGSIDTPLDKIIKTEDDAINLSCIEKLPDLYREIAYKRLVDGLQYKEIAEELNMELNTVRTRIRRAKSMIDKIMNDEISMQ
ncbi:MAG: RNA polymerase sigma factor [Bacteroidales bacterium]|nr:RNA polymerase sigma factor [Bacteroidales bacterium]